MQGDSDSDIENNPDKSVESNSHKKMSREDRKLEAYLKQIEKMEKKEKKRQQTGTPKDIKYPGMKVVHEESVLEGKQTPKPAMKGSRRVMKRGIGMGAQGMRKKRARMSSGSSEPLSPDEHSSTSSTPTTPMHVAMSISEPSSAASCVSPSSSFKFPRGRQVCD